MVIIGAGNVYETLVLGCAKVVKKYHLQCTRKIVTIFLFICDETKLYTKIDLKQFQLNFLPR